MAMANKNAFLNETAPGLPLSDASLPMESPFTEGKLRFETFLKISDEYRERYGYALAYCDNQGNLVYGLPECRRFHCQSCCFEFRRIALEEALNAGKPTALGCSENHGLWGVPVMENNVLNGGLVVAGAPLDQKSDLSPVALAEACSGLLSLAAKHNVTNLAYLESRKDKQQQTERFSRPDYLADDQTVAKLRDFLSDKQPELLSLIRNRNQEAARTRLEEIARFIAELPQDYLFLAKGFVLDLLVAMDHASLDAGCDFTTLMRFNCSVSLEIYQAERPQTLSEILSRSLVQAMSMESPYHKRKNDVVLKNILSYLEKNFNKNLSREYIAEKFGISVSQLSHLLSKKMGRTFVEILNQYRVDRAAQLLVMTDLPLIEIAMECGFQDQSYFGKVFRSHYKHSPARYRNEKTGRPE